LNAPLGLDKIIVSAAYSRDFLPARAMFVVSRVAGFIIAVE
jgi:hypothetical protein